MTTPTMPTTSYRTLAPMRWADVPEALRMTLADIRTLTSGQISRSLDDYQRRAGLRHPCAAASQDGA